MATTEDQRFMGSREKMEDIASAAIRRNFPNLDTFEGVNLYSFRWAKNNKLYHYTEFEEFYKFNVRSAWHAAEPLLKHDESFHIPSFLLT